MANNNANKQILRREEPETASSPTLLPMLIGSLVLTVLGIIVVMIFT